MSTESEPRNPFHPLLLITGLFFIITALAYAVVPMLEKESSMSTPSSGIRESLRVHGWKWLLVELALLIIFGLGLMLLDRSRLKKEQEEGKIHATEPKTSTTVQHETSETDREASQGTGTA